MAYSLADFEDYDFHYGEGYDKLKRPHKSYRYEKYHKGQWIIVDIDCDIPTTSNRTKWWTVGLTISDDYREEALAKCHKEKLITGRMGAYGLLFAKAVIEDFEQFIYETYPDEKNIIYCGWLDKRRRRAYAYALKKLGYKYGIRKFKPCLWKEVK